MQPAEQQPADANAEGAEAAPAPAPAPEPPPAAAPALGIASHYYLSYWEGNCKAVFGCGAGTSHVKRCTVQADNSVTCVEEAAANKALNPDD